MEINPIRQRYSKSCGPACLQMIAEAFGRDLTEKTIIKKLGGLKSYGVCTFKMAELARTLGFKAYCYTFSKRRPGVTFCSPKEELIRRLSKKGAVLLCVDPGSLSGREASRSFHNIVLTSYGMKFSSYADPSDGKIHRIASAKLLGAWTSASKKAVVHTVVVDLEPGSNSTNVS